MQRKDPELTEASRGMETLPAYSKGSAASYKKLSRFFGEEPPRVENLESLLDELGYMEYLPVCTMLGVTQKLISLHACCASDRNFVVMSL